MTCFWDGIMQSLDDNEKSLLGLDNKNSIYSLIDSLKQKNRETNNVLWQNSKFRKSQIIENMEHIRLYDKNTASNGYWCSSCDPFLILICEILEKEIIHDYLGNRVIYKNTKNSKGEINYKSNKGHFWFSNKN